MDTDLEIEFSKLIGEMASSLFEKYKRNEISIDDYEELKNMLYTRLVDNSQTEDSSSWNSSDYWDDSNCSF